MIEGTPGHPYGGLMAHFNVVEANMKFRRQEVTELINADEAVMSLTNFPRLGAPNFTWPVFQPQPVKKFKILARNENEKLIFSGIFFRIMKAVHRVRTISQTKRSFLGIHDSRHSHEIFDNDVANELISD